MNPAEALFSRTQRTLLSLLYGQPERSFYLKELLRLSGMGVATVRRELERMLAAEIITRKIIGNQHHFQANPACPIHEELKRIVLKTLGVVPALRSALMPLQDRIDTAFVFGSIASGRATTDSDIDLLVVGKVTFGELVQALYATQQTLMREINPRVYTAREWRRLLDQNDGFVQELMHKPRLDIIREDEHESGQPAGQDAGTD